MGMIMLIYVVAMASAANYLNAHSSYLSVGFTGRTPFCQLGGGALAGSQLTKRAAACPQWACHDGGAACAPSLGPGE